MDGIDTRISIEEVVSSVGLRSQSEPHPRKLPVKEAVSKDNSDNSQFEPVLTDVSFSTYKSRNEHMAVLVIDKTTGRGIREIPTKEMQKLHGHLDVLV